MGKHIFGWCENMLMAISRQELLSFYAATVAFPLMTTAYDAKD